MAHRDFGKTYPSIYWYTPTGDDKWIIRCDARLDTNTKRNEYTDDLDELQIEYIMCMQQQSALYSVLVKSNRDTM